MSVVAQKRAVDQGPSCDAASPFSDVGCEGAVLEGPVVGAPAVRGCDVSSQGAVGKTGAGSAAALVSTVASYGATVQCRLITAATPPGGVADYQAIIQRGLIHAAALTLRVGRGVRRSIADHDTVTENATGRTATIGSRQVAAQSAILQV